MKFWLPELEKNKYSIIRFAGEDYTRNADLKILPEPDVTIRVFMLFRASDSFVILPEQKIEKIKVRRGFTAVEWGGMNLDENISENY